MDNEPKFETTEPKKLTEDQKVWAQKKAKYDHIKIEAIKKRFKAEIAKLSILKPYNRVYWSMHYMKGSFTTDLMNYNMSWEIWEMLMRGVKEYVVDEQLWARDLAVGIFEIWVEGSDRFLGERAAQGNQEEADG